MIEIIALLFVFVWILVGLVLNLAPIFIDRNKRP